jgi:hypothetical protein
MLMGMAGFGGLFYLKAWVPLTGIEIPCMFRELTGLWCPGCGLTRLVLALMELDFLQAFRYNRLVFFLAPLFVLYWLLERSGKKKQASMLMGVMIVMTIAFGVLRNIPYFKWLAPAVV